MPGQYNAQGRYGFTAGTFTPAAPLYTPATPSFQTIPVIASSVATVTLTNTTIGVIPYTAFGLNAANFDGNMNSVAAMNLVRQSPFKVFRYPGGSAADSFHWQTTSITPGFGGYIQPADTFDNFMTNLVQPTGGQAVISVNYGSNATGTGGGDPAEAAAWVRYANATKGYGIRYWEIGNEIYGSMYVFTFEPNLNANKTPMQYGADVVSFVNAMKAQDGSIKVGAVLTLPGAYPDGVYPDFNSNVLMACGHVVDFVIIHWYSDQGYGTETDAGLLSSVDGIKNFVSPVQTLITTYCGVNAPNVEIWLTELNSAPNRMGKQSVSPVNALYMADAMMTFLESGCANVSMWNYHNGLMDTETRNPNNQQLYGEDNRGTYGDYGLLSSGSTSSAYPEIAEPPADTPFPTYYGLQALLSCCAPGDTMVSSSTNMTGSLISHQVQRMDGSTGLLLINRNPTTAYNVTVSASGFTLGSTYSGVIFQPQQATNTPISGPVSSGITIPAYGLIAVTIR